MRRTNVILAVTAVVTSALALAFTAAQAAMPRDGNPFVYFSLTQGGDTFVNYDGSKNFKRSDRDWPIGLVFNGNASVNKVKDYYKASAFAGFGGSKFLGTDSRPSGGKRKLDSDRGRKTRCGSKQQNGRQEHFRIYGGNLDRLYDREYGYFVVASAHYDHGDSFASTSAAPDLCPGKKFFGYSENVEQRIVDLAATRGARVRRNHLGLRNFEPQRTEGDHIWKNDGRASIIRLP